MLTGANPRDTDREDPCATGLPSPAHDAESSAWIDGLRATGARREAALARLDDLLLRAARTEVRRRAASRSGLGRSELEDIAQQSAHDALLAILRKLDGFRGESRFTTWAYKFALYEAAAGMRRRTWEGREIPLEPQIWPLIADERHPTPQERLETAELLVAVREEIERGLSRHQREVLVAIALNGVPIDVLAERLNTTRGALYKTVHDARQKLRSGLAARGLDTVDEPSRSR